MNIFWEISQEARISAARFAAAQARDKADRTHLQHYQIDRRLEKFMLATAAMWSLLTEKLGVTEAELAERMRELDLRDNRRDEKLPPESRTSEAVCTTCGHRFRTHRPWCPYCGAELGSSPFHDLFRDESGR